MTTPENDVVARPTTKEMQGNAHALHHRAEKAREEALAESAELRRLTASFQARKPEADSLYQRVARLHSAAVSKAGGAQGGGLDSAQKPGIWKKLKAKFGFRS